MIDRRDTRARNFLFGDRRSVEATLAAWAAWRDPRAAGGPARVAALALRGEAANVLGTAAGVRAVERLRGEPFGFELRAQLAPGAAHGEVLAAIGVTRGEPPAAGVFVVVDLAGDAAEVRAVRETLSRHLEGPAGAAPVVIIGEPGAPPLRLGARSGPVERIACALAAPLMDPIVEGVLADLVDQRTPIVVAGAGPRVAQVALGAGDLLIEYAGGAHAMAAARLGELAARVSVPRALTARGQARRTVGEALAALGVTVAVGAAVSGLLVEPVVGPALAGVARAVGV